jgi:hypothetical protein
VILHIGLVATETCLVLRAIDGLAINESAEAPSPAYLFESLTMI